MKRKRSEVSSSVNKKYQLLADIHRKTERVQALQDRVNDSLSSLQNFVDKPHNAKSKSANLAHYQNLSKTTDSLCECIRRVLADIEKIRRIEYRVKMNTEMKRHALIQLTNLQGTALPLWVNGIDGFPPPFVGAIAIPDTIPLKVGYSVAAYFVDNWILAEVVSVIGDEKYEVLDVDDDQQKRKASFSRKQLIPLPHWRADPKHDKHALYPVEAIVLALYPQTTCFYKGVIQKSPTVPSEEYQVAFEDSSYNTGFSPPMPIPQRYVLAYRDGISTKSSRRTVKYEEESE